MSAAAEDAAQQPPPDVESAEDDAAAEDARRLVAQAAERRRASAVRRCCATLGDAEHVCAQLLLDAVDNMFAEMRVREETERSFALVARVATHAVFASLAMPAMQPAESLDRVVRATRDAQSSALQQVLKPDEDEAPTPQQLERAALVRSLRALCARLETPPSAAAAAFLAFPATVFVPAPHAQHRSHQTAAGCKLGSWGIPASELSGVLSHVIAATHACVLPSAVAFVAATSRAALERKQRTLSLAQVQLCVQKALFAAEEALASAAADEAAAPVGHELLPHACYQDEGDPAPTPVDRNAPGSLAKKPTAAAKQELARRVIQAMRPGPGERSRWLSLRSQVLATSDTVTEVAIQADMSLSVASGARPGLKQQAKKLSFAALAADAAAKPPAAAASASTPHDRRNPLGVEPDAAALSNIFSLGTPRQLNAEELARRNDILALLEREEQRNERRMANASIAAMAMPAAASLSESDKSYQAYVAANSSITAPLQGLELGGSRAADACGPRSPTRPPGNARSPSHQLRTKFDLEREPPAFVVSDGNAHVRDELNAFELALSSPIRRPQGRATRDAPASPTRVAAEPTRAEDPSRPVQTASSHLPQLETSRLAVGVRAVVRGVEKRGPKRSPSRKSRLKLHNYTTDGDDPLDRDEREAPPSPIKRPPAASQHQQQPAAPTDSDGSRLLPLIPPVSPIKASPHRKHVRFHGDSRRRATETAESRSDERTGASPLAAAGRRSLPAKQPVWGHTTASPPRVRNRFFAASGAPRKRVLLASDDGDEDDDLNMFKTQFEAPRRSLLPATAYEDD